MEDRPLTLRFTGRNRLRLVPRQASVSATAPRSVVDADLVIHQETTIPVVARTVSETSDYGSAVAALTRTHLPKHKDDGREDSLAQAHPDRARRDERDLVTTAVVAAALSADDGVGGP